MLESFRSCSVAARLKSLKKVTWSVNTKTVDDLFTDTHFSQLGKNVIFHVEKTVRIVLSPLLFGPTPIGADER